MDVHVPDFPANEAMGSHVVPFTRTIFIEQSDFREVCVGTFQNNYSVVCDFQHVLSIVCVRVCVPDVLSLR